MTDVWFYHLERQPLEFVLPRILAGMYARGDRICVHVASAPIQKPALLQPHKININLAVVKVVNFLFLCKHFFLFQNKKMITPQIS